MLVDEVYEEYQQFDPSDLKAIEADTSMKVEALYKGTHAFQLFAQNVVVPVLRGQLGLSDFERALVVIYFRMYARMRSLVRLNSMRYLQSVADDARGTLELLIDLKVLENAPDQAAAFHAFTQVERYRAAKQLVAFLDVNSTFDKSYFIYQRNWTSDAARTAEVEGLVETHWGRTKKGDLNWPRHWSGRDLAARAKSAGPQYESLYRAHYPQLSWYSHGGFVGFAGLSVGTLESVFGVCHSLVHQIVMEATLIVGDRFHLFKAEPVLRENLEKVRLTPGAALLQRKMALLRELGERGKRAGQNGTSTIAGEAR